MVQHFARPTTTASPLPVPLSNHASSPRPRNLVHLRDRAGPGFHLPSVVSVTSSTPIPSCSTQSGAAAVRHTTSLSFLSTLPVPRPFFPSLIVTPVQRRRRRKKPTRVSEKGPRLVSYIITNCLLPSLSSCLGLVPHSNSIFIFLVPLSLTSLS